MRPKHQKAIRHSGAFSVHANGSRSIAGKKVIISTGGTAKNLSLAKNKAISEYVERLFFYEKLALKNKEIDTTGLACRAFGLSRLWELRAIVRAATSEYLERYAIHTWWSQTYIRHVLEPVNSDNYQIFLKSLIDLDMKNSFEKLDLIRIPLNNKSVVFLAIGYLPDSGFVIGSSAGSWKDKESILFQAVVEQMRHWHIFKTNQNIGDTPYITKIQSFAKGRFDQALIKRLSVIGEQTIIAPKLKRQYYYARYFQRLYLLCRVYQKNFIDFISDEDSLCL